MSSVNRAYLLGAVSAVALFSAHPSALAADASAQAAAPQQATSIGEVVVTARRREESLEKTPVAVQVVSPQQMKNAAVKTMYDLVTLTPGVNISAGISSANPVISIRGSSRGLTGDAQPSVVVYFDEVPNIKESDGMPLYDVTSLQVLKGPQGTLFGRNATAGAILVTSKPPTFELGASAQVSLGNYNLHTVEGELNLPIIQDKVAVRLAGQMQRRDAYTIVVNDPSHTSDSQKIDNFRVSLLIEPTDKLRNLTVFDYSENYAPGAMGVFYSYNPAQAPPLPWLDNSYLYVKPPFVPGPACNHSIYCSIADAFKLQQILGPRYDFVNLSFPNPVAKQGDRALVNTTTYDFGFMKAKNVFGFRRHDLGGSGSDIGGTPFEFVNTQTIWNFDQLSDEFNISGTALKGDLSWIGGLFWLKEQPGGTEWSSLQVFSQVNQPFGSNIPVFGLGGTGAQAAPFTTDESKAIYGQITYKFENLWEGFKGLSTDLGIRYNKDTSAVCSIVEGLTFFSPKPQPDQCPQSRTPMVGFSKVTYTAGLNYQVTDQVLAYVVKRRGYRAGFVNAPIFGGELTPFQGVKPEVVDDVEAGLKTTWNLYGMPGKFNFAAYQSKYKDLQASISTSQVLDPDGDGNPNDNPVSNTFFVNLGNAQTEGIEIDGAISPIEGLQLSGAASWLGKKITSISLATLPAALLPSNPENPYALEPVAFSSAVRYGYSFSADYKIPAPERYGAFNIGMTWFENAKLQYASGGLPQTLPSYYNVNAYLNWTHVLNSNFDIDFFCTNLTDVVAAIGPANDTSGLGFQSVFYNEPRMFGATIRYAFGSER